jgi:hypothetical protein
VCLFCSFGTFLAFFPAPLHQRQRVESGLGGRIQWNKNGLFINAGRS